MPTSVLSTAQTPLLTALEKNLHEHIAFVQRSTPGMTVFDQADLLVVDSGTSPDSFNKMARARLPESDVDRRIAAAVAYFTGVERPFAGWVGPGLAAFESRRSITGLWSGGHRIPAGHGDGVMGSPPKLESLEDVTVRRVTCAEEFTDFAGVFAANWEPPNPAAFEF